MVKSQSHWWLIIPKLAKHQPWTSNINTRQTLLDSLKELGPIITPFQVWKLTHLTCIRYRKHNNIFIHGIWETEKFETTLWKISKPPFPSSVKANVTFKFCFYLLVRRFPNPVSLLFFRSLSRRKLNRASTMGIRLLTVRRPLLNRIRQSPHLVVQHLTHILSQTVLVWVIINNNTLSTAYTNFPNQVDGILIHPACNSAQ